MSHSCMQYLLARTLFLGRVSSLSVVAEAPPAAGALGLLALPSCAFLPSSPSSVQ